jgi:Flp pilus assembly CpaF family ATPase
MTLSTDELTTLAERVRRDHGRRLPAAAVRESHGDRERRLERTKYELETQVLPLVNEERVAARERALSPDDEDRLVETILSSMFLLPRLLGILEREPLAEDVVVLGSSPVRVDRADGTVGLYEPIVRADRDLELVIADVASAHHRPFNFEAPFVDVQLSPRLRFHGQGFDVVSRPMIAIRVHRALGATFDDLYSWGALSAGLRYFLGDAATGAGLSQAYTGPQGSGKTTFVRAVGLAYDESTRMLTIETDFELGLASLGRPWTQEMQARIPVVASGSGITPADLMRPALRTRAEVNIIGEVRGDEAGPAVRAASIGQGTVVTVHGITAEAGLEQLVDLMALGNKMPRDLARASVYKSFDVVVLCAMSRSRRRWVQEVVAPSMEGDRPVLHTLYAPRSGTGDLRARSTPAAWPDLLLARIATSWPDFDLAAALDDHCEPIAAPGAAETGSITSPVRLDGRLS